MDRDTLSPLQKVQLIIALRFTSSRRGNVSNFAQMILDGTLVDKLKFDGDDGSHPIKCGQAYQQSDTRWATGEKLEGAALAVLDRVDTHGPLETVSAAAAVIKEKTATEKGQRKFSSTEAAKDLAYLPGFLAADASKLCELGPGALKGLASVRKKAKVAAKPAPKGANAFASMVARASPLPSDNHACCSRLLKDLHALGPELKWMEMIDVEQALCEFEKYNKYIKKGFGKKAFPKGKGDGANTYAATTTTTTSAAKGKGKKRAAPFPDADENSSLSSNKSPKPSTIPV